MKKLLQKIKAWFLQSEPTQPAERTDVEIFKSIIKKSVAVAGEIKAAKADQKISGGEWLSIAKEALPMVRDLSKFKALKAAVLDFQTSEGIEIVAYCVDLGILKGDVPVIVQHAIGFIEGQIVLYNTHVKPVLPLLKRSK